jgi:hypothetical protein
LDEIPKEPKIPPKLVQKINEKKVCFFLGAGVSRLIGCKGWSELAKSPVEKCYKLDCITYRQRESILRINEPKKVLTICYNRLREKGLDSEFFDEISQSLEPDPELRVSHNLYEELSDIPAIFITTNIDTHFDSAFKDGIVYEEADFNPKNVFRGKLYKIHGTIGDRNSIIFTVPQYLTRYRKKDFTEFLIQIFSTYSIVFLGYGFEEYEILDFLVTRFGEETKELNHWILLPYYQGEGYLLAYDKEYFSPLGIDVIGFEKDIDGYGQLYKVIKKWRKEIAELSDITHEDIMKMEKLVDDFGST